MAYSVFRFLPLMLVLLSACTNTVKMDAPFYQPAASTTVLLQNNHAGQINVGPFQSNQDRNVDPYPVSVHGYVGFSIGSPYNDSFSEYLENALRMELRQAGSYSPQSPTVVSGTLMATKVDVSPSFWGLDDAWTASMTVRFVVNRNNQTVFDKVVTKEHPWESVQLPRYAIPNALKQYIATIQLLVQSLVSDPDFIVATRPGAAALPGVGK